MTGVVVLISILVICLTSFVIYLYHLIWLRPRRLRSKLKQQGIDGPPPSFLYGNIPDINRIQSETAASSLKAELEDVGHFLSHNYVSYLFPYLDKWKKEYGSTFAFTTGNVVVVCISDFETTKEFCLSKSIEFGRSSTLKNNRGALLGYNSIVTSKGTSWAYQRKIIAPEFFIDKVKSMTDMMIQSTGSMVKQWEAKIEEGGGVASIRVDEDLKELSAEIISKTCFGTNYLQGKEIFARIGAIQDLLSKQSEVLGLPGIRYYPTKNNREVWRLDREINNSVVKLMKSHQDHNNNEDFFKVLMKKFCSNGTSIGSNTNISLIVDNCKAVFFAGHETTATAAAFTLLLLAYHQDWQKQLRDEVLDVCAGQVPTVDMLKKSKKLTMVIYETLRLYPSSPIMTRETSEEMKFGNYAIPKGVTIWLEVAAVHQDPANWGSNAAEFCPERFANGISGACKVPRLFVPFGAGIRTCVGQSFAMMELKIVLSLILPKFAFSLSPNYRHSVAYKGVSVPENGVYLNVERI